MNDLISRQAAISTVRKCSVKEVTPAFMLVDKAEVMTDQYGFCHRAERRTDERFN